MYTVFIVKQVIPNKNKENYSNSMKQFPPIPRSAVGLTIIVIIIIFIAVNNNNYFNDTIIFIN